MLKFISTQRKLLILTGPPAAGKNTIATAFAKKRKRCVMIDVDAVRQMVIQPGKAPWEGKEGHKQQLLGVQNTCTLAKNFLKEGYDVVIADVLSHETASIYKKQLKKFKPHIVLLLPTWKEIVRRNKLRKQWLTDKEIKMLYEDQTSFVAYDFKIDNSNLSVEEVTTHLLQL